MTTSTLRRQGMIRRCRTSSLLTRRRSGQVIMSFSLIVTAVLILLMYMRSAAAYTFHEFFPVGHVTGKRGAIASNDIRCTRIGETALRKGGSAADAVIATQICQGVVAMWLSGIAGGGFALVRSPKGLFEFVDFRETAPAAAYEDMFVNNSAASLYGGLASGVPGELRGLQWLHKSYGRLSWKELILPSADLACNGFLVTADQVDNMNALGARKGLFTQDPEWAQDFAPNGKLLAVGDLMTRKRYCKLLRKIASGGADVFYKDKIAGQITAALRAANGTMTAKDLENYKVILRNPLEITYRNFRIVSCSAPSGGPVVLSVLKTVEGYTNFGANNAINISVHRLDEAIRFGYGARAYLGDPIFVPTVKQYQAEMIQKRRAEDIRKRISNEHTLNVSAYNPKGFESLETPGTSHIVSTDVRGLTVSMTSTINNRFGSQIMVPELGLIMNNEMGDFSIPGSSNVFGYRASPANFVRPGKRPLSAMSPTIVEHLQNGTLFLAIGAAGGSRIITSVIQSLWNVLDRRMSPIEALRAPRFHDSLSPNQIFFEYAYNNDTVNFMQQRGHNVSWFGYASTVEAIGRTPNGTFLAAADPRSSNGSAIAI